VSFAVVTTNNTAATRQIFFKTRELKLPGPKVTQFYHTVVPLEAALWNIKQSVADNIPEPAIIPGRTLMNPALLVDSCLARWTRLNTER